MNTINLADINIDNVTLEEALQQTEQLVRADTPHLVVTPNPEMIVAAQKDQLLREIINERAALRLPDGISMIVVSHLLGRPLRQRVTGIDFLQAVCRQGAKSGWKIFLLGSAPGVAEKAATNLRMINFGLQVVGTHHGYFKDNSQEEADVIRQINALRPDMLFVGLGAGRQEKWLTEHLPELGIKVGVGVGGSFDVISGIKKRAPLWAQKLYIEWLYRLVTEPQRWKRQLALPIFLWLTLITKRG
ncbi:hypothetical protein A2311_06600 [candidate division WOR-1 bacterium RIFOXYB2_FULL_48_7]|uniref:Glycosyl transferase n=1 Tax=candidate division WOR-1 bacterium RIFOXYB2_FULL_48_7 TaxID=1802583 RepID=A0A1F4T9I6_UNCSA|nr:MAG: hypothetical protein A2311_06600 [candidate division WOR-1 bacterium RIFOXYB2_FULL_48_7]